MRPASVLWLPTIVSTIILLPCLLLLLPDIARAINVNLPDEFEQCMPATIGISQSKGNVSIVIHEDGVRRAIVNVSLPLNTTSWNWTAVNISAGENFTIAVTDRSPTSRTKRLSFQSTVDLNTTNNDTTCLPVRSTRKGKNSGGSGDPANGLGADSGPGPKKKRTTEVSIIAGVLGGLLFALLSLILFMCWKRRRESRNQPAQDDQGNDAITARRMGDMRHSHNGQQVVTLFSEDGRPEGQAILGREGDAGWSYMARIVPGLTSDNTGGYVSPHNNAGPRRKKGDKTKRYDQESKDGELPSYRLSEYERKALPKYADGGRVTQASPPRLLYQHPSQQSGMVLTTRRDSQGSRLTFQPDALDPNGIETTPRHSAARSQVSRYDEGGEDDDEVIVFRPASIRSGEMPYDRSDGEHDSSMYSEAANNYLAYQANSSAIQSHPDTNAAAFHRRSRSEASLRHMPPQGHAYYR